MKRAVPLSFATLNATADLLLNITLAAAAHTVGGGPARRLQLQVRLLQVPTVVPGAVAVDHSTRGLLVVRVYLPVIATQSQARHARSRTC